MNTLDIDNKHLATKVLHARGDEALGKTFSKNKADD